ncbi:Nucleolar protein 12 [Exophiala xenobiotica]|uniref:Nucleolar protein 12 n=1 Tax=Vermiconidia calcicola TaxID=1690605 RepID=A0AAV9QIP2_9PEZI|nr:Nucleolar protein 12 [Exophiala xenobiotica]KAK5543615.1 Nucleolar protein 12 [Vermiconidia calcicola]KAK5548277.1 Nucleolar protein 12 [Chaetothyriales sp. CCFEE 6169]KAK5231130.1 Nucleolar protein 12 [Exophiala xenobiotica]KAK5237934.1 Nucleolar protein 12 [Exophiala xenobiotica]
MAKSKKPQEEKQTAPSTPFAGKTDSVDPTLASLFASSSGPVTVSTRVPQPVTPATSTVRTTKADETSSESDAEDPDILSKAKKGNAAAAPAVEETVERPRKRRRKNNKDDLEEQYFQRLEREEEKEYAQKKQAETGIEEETSGDVDSLHSDLEDISEDEVAPAVPNVPRHETQEQKSSNQASVDMTVFLGNVSTDAIKSTKAKRTLTKHLQSALKEALDGQTPEKLESIRFRSTAYASDSGPKKATYAKKELMDETTVSTNAYAVFSTKQAAMRVAKALNGSVVLDRHLRADYLGQPSKVDHKRCIFIGNLSFVNKETKPEDEDGEQRRPTAKEPADAEEGLWRVFGKIGKVESVRVVRDQETRVSKGFAYVQFESENSVEAALLMNDKKFPPMLPRKLRVMRAKKVKQSGPPKGRPADKGQTRKRSGAFGNRKNALENGLKKAAFVFEGHRASSANKFALSKKKKNKKRPDNRSSRRGAEFKATGGKRKRDA